MARNSTERAWWQVRSGVERIRFFPAHSSRSQISSSSIEEYGIMLVLKSVVFLRDYLSDVSYHLSSCLVFVAELLVLLLHERIELWWKVICIFYEKPAHSPCLKKKIERI